MEEQSTSKYSKYSFCGDGHCKKFEEMQDKVLAESSSAFDAAIDMWAFVDECCKYCEDFERHKEEIQN